MQWWVERGGVGGQREGEGKRRVKRREIEGGKQREVGDQEFQIVIYNLKKKKNLNANYI